MQTTGVKINLGVVAEKIEFLCFRKLSVRSQSLSNVETNKTQKFA